jgi:hypothetical protein
MLAGLADAQQALSDRLEAAVGALRKEMKPSLQQVQQGLLVGAQTRACMPWLVALKAILCECPMLCQHASSATHEAF